jgi:hypothetical protein
MKVAAVLAILLFASLAAGCGGSNSTTPTPTTPSTPTITTETFFSALGAGGVASHGFIVSTAGTVSVTLLTTAPSGLTLGLGLGIPNANGASCNLSTALNTTQGSTAQIATSVEPGAYCVSVYDAGNLRADVTFTVQIVHP